MEVKPEGELVADDGLTAGCTDGLTESEVLAAGVAALAANGLRTPGAKVSERLTRRRLTRKQPVKPPPATARERRLLEILRSDM